MPGIINSFLRTELTIIPQAIKKYVGSYNNGLTNGATWMFFIWTLLHTAFDHTVNRLLSKMQYKEYIRLRLIDAVWNLGFYSSCFWFCSASLYKHNGDVFNHRRIIREDMDNSENYMFGFILLITYVLHSCVRNFIVHGLCLLPINNLLMAIFLFATCITSKLELCYGVMAIISFGHSGIELVRCAVSVLKISTKMTKFLSKLLIIVAVFLFLLSYGFTLPIVIVLPLAHELLLKMSSLNLWILNITLWMWLLSEIFNNIAYKLVKHVVVHKKSESQTCLGSTVECVFFFPRDDLAYHLKIVRKEIEERRRGESKPKRKNALFKTLKSVAMLSMLDNADKEAIKDKNPVEIICEGMIAMKRKLHQKRMADSSDSESESEISDMIKSDDNEPESCEENEDIDSRSEDDKEEEKEECEEDNDADSEETEDDTDGNKEDV